MGSSRTERNHRGGVVYPSENSELFLFSNVLDKDINGPTDQAKVNLTITRSNGNYDSGWFVSEILFHNKNDINEHITNDELSKVSSDYMWRFEKFIKGYFVCKETDDGLLRKPVSLEDLFDHNKEKILFKNTGAN